jgi:hypothetical protein
VKSGAGKTFKETDCEGIIVAICAPNFHLLNGTLELERRHSIGQVSQDTGHRDTPHAMHKIYAQARKFGSPVLPGSGGNPVSKGGRAIFAPALWPERDDPNPQNQLARCVVRPGGPSWALASGFPN